MSRRNPVRILALLEAASISGTAKAVLELAYEAKADAGGERPIEVLVANFMRGDGGVDNALTRALQAAQIPFAFIREQGRFDRSVIPQIRELVRQNDAQVIWTNSVKSHFLVYRAGVQRVCQWVAFHHGYTSTDFKMRLYNEMDRISLRHANRVVTVCKPFAAQMEGCGVPRSRIRVQHMPIRPFSTTAGDSAELRSELKLPSDSRVVLSVGRLSHEKGQADLLTAFARLREQLNDGRLCLVLVGDGPERAKLEQQATAHGMKEQVVFTGQRDDAKRFYGIATVFALPSYTEGTPNVLLESMAAGVPVVATDVGGIPELASDGRNALLVPSSNPAALANAMASLMLSPNLREGLAKAARSVVEEHSPRSYFEHMREIFVETVD